MVQVNDIPRLPVRQEELVWLQKFPGVSGKAEGSRSHESRLRTIPECPQTEECGRGMYPNTQLVFCLRWAESQVFSLSKRERCLSSCRSVPSPAFVLTLPFLWTTGSPG